MKKWLLLSASFAFTQVFSAYIDEDIEDGDEFVDDEAYEYVGYSTSDDMQRDNTNYSTRRKKSDAEKKKEEERRFAYGINTPARPVLAYDWGNVWLMGEALCWQATQDNLYYASFEDEPPNNTIDPLRLEFDWNWGARLGAGYNIPRDGWDIGMEWTHIENRARGHGAGSSLPQLWGDPRALITVEGPTDRAAGHWKVHLDQIDLELGREFYVGRYMTIRPKVGMRSAFIFQRLKSKVSITEGLAPIGGPVPFGDNITKLTNRFWGFGFEAGLDTDWKLGYGFSLFGEADFSLLFGFFKVRERGTILTNGAQTNRWSSENSFRTEKPILDLAMGFKWFGKFCDDHFGLTFKAGYEYHLYMNHNQFQQPTGDTNFTTLSPLPGDLGYQGVTLTMQFDF